MQQKMEFTFKGVCAYVLYWAMEERMTGVADSTAESTLFESNELQMGDQERIGRILDKIVKDGRIAKVSAEETRYVKQL